MAWRLASSLDVLRQEINAAYPNRSKISDGTIGDAAHQSQGSASDHNPWITVGGGVGVVSALDITTRGGSDPGDEVAELIRRDPRTKYVIRDGRIAYGGGDWQPYNGSDPHDTHMHVSVRASAGDYDNTTAWGVSAGIGGGALRPSEEDDMYDAAARNELIGERLDGEIIPTLRRIDQRQAAQDGSIRNITGAVAQVQMIVADPQYGMAVQLGRLAGVVAGLSAAQSGVSDQAALEAAAEKGAREALADLTLVAKDTK